MKKLFSVFAATLFAAAMSAGVVTFTGDDFEGQGTANTGSDVSKTKSGVTVSATRAYGAPANTEKGYPAELRVYGANTKEGIAGGVLTISADSKITKIHAEFTDYTKMTFEDQTPNKETWSITADKQIRMTKIEVTIEGEGGGEGGGEGEGGEGGGSDEAIKLDFVYADVALFEEDGMWGFNLYKDYDYDSKQVTYPDGYFYVDVKSVTAIAGTYTAEELIAGYVALAKGDTIDVVEVVENLKVSCVEDGITYRATMKFVADNDKTYYFDAELDTYAYNYDTEEAIDLTDKAGGEGGEGGGEEQGIENISATDNIALKVLHNGQLIIMHNGKAYSVTGARVK